MSIAKRRELPQRWASAPHASWHTALLAWGVYTLTFLLAVGTSRAEPDVRVRAESRVEIGVEYVDGSLQVRGALRDELAEPIAHRDVRVTLRDPEGELIESKLVATGAAGRFVVEREAPEAQVTLQASFAGDGLYRGVRVERRIDPTRADVRLELQLPDGPKIDLDAERLSIRVLAESDSGGDRLPMQLQDETARVVARGETDALGRLTWKVPTRLLGAPGSGLLRLESAGDATRGEAQTEARVVRFRRSRLELSPPDDGVEAGSGALVQGRLFTAAGPRAGQPVGVFMGGEHAVTAVTAADGSFSARLWPAEAGRHDVVARVERDPVGAYTGAEQRLTLTVTPPRALPWPWLLAALVPVSWLLGSRVRRRRRVVQRERMTTGVPQAGVQAAPRQHRRATEHRVTGRVLHARTRAPVAAVRIRAQQRGETRWETYTADDGWFESPSCEGHFTLSVEKAGYADLSTAITAPHRGEWSRCEIRLESLRDHAMQAFRRVVSSKLPSALAFNLWTPREIAQSLKPLFGGRIEAMRERVEHAAFAPEPPRSEDVRALEAAASDMAGRTAETRRSPTSRRSDSQP